MNIQTHHNIDYSLCGHPILLEAGKSEVKLETLQVMQADAKGLVHGGFIFGLADYAAMLAVNDINVVLGSAQSKFLKPVKVGDVVVAKAVVIADEGRKKKVQVNAFVDELQVFSGEFTCFVLDKHVLD